jgi:hypothetical protein
MHTHTHTHTHTHEYYIYIYSFTMKILTQLRSLVFQTLRADTHRQTSWRQHICRRCHLELLFLGGPETIFECSVYRIRIKIRKCDNIKTHINLRITQLTVREVNRIQKLEMYKQHKFEINDEQKQFIVLMAKLWLSYEAMAVMCLFTISCTITLIHWAASV